MIVQDSKDEDSIRFLQKILIGQGMRYFIVLKETLISLNASLNDRWWFDDLCYKNKSFNKNGSFSEIIAQSQSNFARTISCVLMKIYGITIWIYYSWVLSEDRLFQHYQVRF